MKFLSIIFFMSLIAFSLNAVTKTTFDLKSGQTVQTGSNVKVKITVQITGDATDTQDFKTGTFTLQNTDNATETATLTCSLDTAVTATYAASSPVAQEVECTVATLTTAGTYKLSAVTAATSNGTTDISGKEVKTTTPTTLTVTEAPAGGSGGSGGSSGSGDGNTNTNGAKGLTAFYSLIALILFL